MLDRHIKRFQREWTVIDLDNFTNVSMHFNENGHTTNDFSFAPIDKIEAEWPRLLKETYWMHRLNTLHPNGMNSKVLYQIPNK